MQMNIELDRKSLRRFEQELRRLSKKEIPRVMATVLTETAKDASNSVRRTLKDSLGVKDRQAFRGVRVTPATATTQAATVGVSNKALAKKITRARDQKFFPAGTVVGLPRRNAKTAARLKVEPLAKILRKRRIGGLDGRPFKLTTKSGFVGVAARIGNARLPVTILYKAFKVGRRGVFDFHDIVQSTVDRKFIKNANAAIKKEFG